MCDRPERLLQRCTEGLNEAGCLKPRRPQRSVLTESRAQGELVAVDAAGDTQPRPLADEIADHLVVAQGLGNGQRVGVEVEQAPAACYRRGEVAKIVEAE